MEEPLYTKDGEYYLVPICESEKKFYALLSRENDSVGNNSIDETYVEYTWKSLLADSKNKRIYSIYTAGGEFFGSIDLREADSSTPEIGIEILKTHRNKGIAGKIISLLVKSESQMRTDIEYFILKVSAANLHSKHVIEKTGAIHVRVEDSYMVEALKVFCAGAKEENDLIAYEKYSKKLEDLIKDEQKKVLVYKLTEYDLTLDL